MGLGKVGGRQGAPGARRGKVGPRGVKRVATSVKVPENVRRLMEEADTLLGQEAVGVNWTAVAVAGFEAFAWYVINTLGPFNDEGASI